VLWSENKRSGQMRLEVAEISGESAVAEPNLRAKFLALTLSIFISGRYLSPLTRSSSYVHFRRGGAQENRVVTLILRTTAARQFGRNISRLLSPPNKQPTFPADSQRAQKR